MKGIISSRAKRNSVFFTTMLFLGNLAYTQITVTGQITATNSSSGSGFAVLATGTENKIAYTDVHGNYTFTLQQGGTYEIKPLDCSDNPLNGLTTYDWVWIGKHYMGIEPLASPYEIIAADADNSGVIDSLDVEILRKLLLATITELPGGNYKFVPKSYVFPDEMNPFSPPYPQSSFIPNLQSGISGVDFYVIKIGDVRDLTGDADYGCYSPPDLPARISGRVYRDQSSDCLYTAGEAGLAGWNVLATNVSGAYYGTTNSAGYYEINLLPGVYDVILSRPNDLWSSCIDTVSNIIATTTSGNSADFAVQADISCPALEVDLSAAILRRCFNNVYTVHYCNLGTATAENVRVELDLDPFYIFMSSNVPSQLLNGNTYSFEIGDVPSGQCGQFLVFFNLSCDAELGQTHCTEARIYPDTMCTIPGAWTGPDLGVEGICDGDEVRFTITNHGGDMLEPSSYIVIEDIVVMVPPIQNPFTLSSGSSAIITFPGNGATKRMEVSQPAGHPWSDKASATVEGCGTNSNGTFSTGMVNIFPQNDQSPFVDVDCLVNTGSFDPNEKEGVPSGVTSAHFIPLNQPIEYTIRFQNTGTDTAFTVIIRDTLDGQLDVNTIRPLGSSHPYTFNLSGEGVAQFIFTNIMLPDSNTNEAASHGYVKFVIAPQANMPEGTIIENDAAIYFDFNEPVITNSTWHTLGTAYLGSSNVVFDPKIGLDVFPNPASDDVHFLLKSPSLISGTLELFDIGGHLVAKEPFEYNKLILKGKPLTAGYYLYKINSENHLLASGKLIKVE